MERAKRSGGLHKRSAEDWGSGLRARGGWPPSWSEGRRCGQERGRYRTPHSDGQRKVDDRLIELMFLRFANRVASIWREGVPCRFRRPKHVRDALWVVRHRCNADFGSRTSQPTHQQARMSEDAVFDRSERMFNRASTQSHGFRRDAFLIRFKASSYKWRAKPRLSRLIDLRLLLCVRLLHAVEITL